MNQQQGVSLYLAITIMTILLAIVLGISTILIRQLKTIKGMENSVIAFYAADTGVERVLKVIYHDQPESIPTETYHGFFDLGGGGTGINCPDDFDPADACYRVELTPAGGGCSATYFCIKSVGVFKEARRAIEVNL